MDLFTQPNIVDGFMISVIGMGVVMCFLVLMMYVMKLTEFVMAKLAVWCPEEVAEAPVAKSTSQSKNDTELAIAIAAAKNFFAKGGN